MFPFFETPSCRSTKNSDEKTTNLSNFGKCPQKKSLSDDFTFMTELLKELSPLVEKTENTPVTNDVDNYDIVEIKDDNGNVVANRIDVVVAPFKKADISVSINTGNRTISVVCDSTKKDLPASNEKHVFKGISSRLCKWTWDIPERAITQKITSKLENGILKITIPLFVDEEKADEVMSISID